MTDPISTAILSVKTIFGMAKVIRDTGDALKDAEVKSKLTDLVVALSDVQMQLVDAQMATREKDERIAELESAFEGKDELCRHNDGMYVVDDAGNPKGGALCVRCWEQDHRRRSLVLRIAEGRAGGGSRIWPTCKTQYDGRLTNAYNGSSVDI